MRLWISIRSIWHGKVLRKKFPARGGGWWRRLHQNFGNFQSLLAERRFECFYNSRIEILARSPGDHVPSLERRRAFAIRPVAHQCIVNVGDGDGARFDGNFLAFGGMIARSIEFIVVTRTMGRIRWSEPPTGLSRSIPFIVRFPQFAQPALSVFVERPGHICGNQ